MVGDPGGGGTSKAVDLLNEVPVVSAVLGSVAGLPAIEACLCHFSVMVKNTSQVFAGGPPVVKAALGYDVTKEELGDYNSQVFKTGVIDTNLMGKLIILRKDIAKKNSLPPYAILQEFSLEDMTYKYPTSLEEFKNINGVGEGKVNKFGNYFIKLIKEYIEENQIQKPDDLVLRTSGEKSSKKLSLIQNIDKKIPLDEISDSRGIEFTELLSELESIVFSGTKLDIDYYLEEILDEDQQEELKEYFLESESEDISDALEEFDGDYDEEELRLYRIKFLNDVSN